MKKILKALSRLMILNFVVIASLVFMGNLKKEVKQENPVVVTPAISPAGPSVSITVEPSTPPTPDLFSQVPEHNIPGDCWMIVRGRVYNVTPLFGSHPGGDGAIAPYCGQDATSAFNTRNKNPAQNHSAADEAMLNDYLIQ